MLLMFAISVGFFFFFSGDNSFFFLVTFSELEERSEAKGREDVESLAWNKQIAPLLQELESVAAGSFWGLFFLEPFHCSFFHLV